MIRVFNYFGLKLNSVGYGSVINNLPRRRVNSFTNNGISKVQEDIRYNVSNEFGKLNSVLIGRADGFRLPAPEHEPLLRERNSAGVYNLCGKPYPKTVVDEANASLEELITKCALWVAVFTVQPCRFLGIR